MRIGIVAEGQHDFLMLEPLLRSAARSRGVDDISVIALQPRSDATMGSSADGGWPRVMGWCQRHSAEKLATYFYPLFEDQPAVDVLLLHLDGNAVDLCSFHTARPLPSAPYKIGDRFAHLQAVLIEWLSPSAEFSQKLAFAIPTLHTEAWILAALQTIETPYEELDAKDVLRRTFRRPRYEKLALFYGRVSAQSAAMEERIADRCVSYQLSRSTWPGYQ